MNSEFWFGSASVALTVFLGFYTLWRIWRGTIKPHVFSVFLWLLLTIIGFVNLMFAQDAGAAAWRTGFMALLLLTNFLITIKNGFGYVRKSDWLFLFSALAVIPIWLVTHDADLALCLLLVIDVAATVPTATKAFHTPYDLSPGVYLLTAVAQVLQLFALFASSEHASSATIAYMASFPLTYLSLSGLIYVRRKQIPHDGGLAGGF